MAECTTANERKGERPVVLVDRTARLAGYFLGDDMTIARTEYFKDVLTDAEIALEQVGYSPEDHIPLLAALIMSDSFNGIRKAILQLPSVN